MRSTTSGSIVQMMKRPRPNGGCAYRSLGVWRGDAEGPDQDSRLVGEEAETMAHFC